MPAAPAPPGPALPSASPPAPGAHGPAGRGRGGPERVRPGRPLPASLLGLLLAAALPGCAPPAPPPASGCGAAAADALAGGGPALAAAGAPLLPGAALSAAQVEGEAARLRAAFLQEVSADPSAASAADTARIARAHTALAAAGVRVGAPQLILLVDRNPAVQEGSILLVRPAPLPWAVIGTTRVSTGQAGRRGYYITPTGAFPHTAAIRDYRAMGTPNAQGIRGLGARGMRVWDFGWVAAPKGWREDGEQGPIRLLIHATDPDHLEQRIGQPASQGCVRVPAAMNRFLDRHGVLDAEHEAAAREDARYRALLDPERAPTPLAGRLLVVVDSAEAVP